MIKKLMFAFTYPESSFLYIVTTVRTAMGEGNIIKIPFDQLQKYMFLTLLHREGYKDTEGKKFTIHAKAWDCVVLTCI
jgi:hypothetical protein